MSNYVTYHYTSCAGRKQRYKQSGNGVTVPVIEAIEGGNNMTQVTIYVLVFSVAVLMCMVLSIAIYILLDFFMRRKSR